MVNGRSGTNAKLFMIIISEQIHRAIFLVLMLSSVPLGLAMIVGLFVSIVQAATQIHDQTLTFAPKVAVVWLVLIFAGGWFAGKFHEFFSASYLMLSVFNP